MSRWAVSDIGVLIGYNLSWQEQQVTYYFLLVYTAAGIAIIVFIGSRTIVVQIIGLNAARELHTKMLWRLLKSPVSFFDQTPVRRIVNRFTSDFQSIDREVADNFVGVARNLLDLITSFAIIVVVLPLFSLWILPMLYLYYRVQRSYRKTAREVKRLSSTSRSPIFQHFNETINGLITMRAFSATQRFQDKACENVDVFTRTIMCQATIGRWLSIRLQSLGAITLFFTSLNLTLFPDLIDAGLAGLAINYSNMATGCLQMFISSFTELELKMNGIERVKYYTEVTTERPYIHDPTAPLSDPARQIVTAPVKWPHRGEVSFKQVSTRYRPGLELVLDDVSFEVRFESPSCHCLARLCHISWTHFRCMANRLISGGRRAESWRLWQDREREIVVDADAVPCARAGRRVDHHRRYRYR